MPKNLTREQRDVAHVKAMMLGHTTCFGCRAKYTVIVHPEDRYGKVTHTNHCANRQEQDVSNDRRCRYFDGPSVKGTHFSYPQVSLYMDSGNFYFMSYAKLTEVAKRAILRDFKRRYIPIKVISSQDD